jgi:hypothetical protein
MLQLSLYDPAERQREKNRVREQDDIALRNGDISREELRMRNSFLAPLQIVGSSIERPSLEKQGIAV